MLEFVFAMTTVLFVVVSAMFLSLSFISWSLSKSKNNPKIKFKDFKKFYLINPSRWELYDTKIGCLDESKYSYSFGHHYIRLEFSYFDYLKYVIWKTILKHKKKNIKNTETMLRVVELVKKDIAKSEELAQKRQDEALDNLDKILGI